MSERAQIPILLSRLEAAPTRPIMVAGLRQTGKTTLMQQVLERIEAPSLYFAVDEPEPATLPPPNRLSLEGAHLGSNWVPCALGDERDGRWLVRQWERAGSNAGEPEERSRDTFSMDEANRIAICVVDVATPGT